MVKKAVKSSVDDSPEGAAHARWVKRIDRDYAAFAQGEFDLTDALTVIAGLRYYKYDNTVFGFSGTNTNGNLGTCQVPRTPYKGTPCVNVDKQSKDDGFIWKGTVKYDITDAVMLYGTVSRGFRAPNLDDLAILGDFAGGDRIPNFDLDPETVINLEVGTKYLAPVTRAGASVALAMYEDMLANKLVFTEDGTNFFQVDNVSRANIFSLEAWLERVLIQGDGASPEHSVYSSGFWSVGRDYTTVSRQVSKLESLELVARESTADRRVRKSVITPKGKAMTDRIDEARARIGRAIFATWDEADVENLVRLMCKFANDIKDDTLTGAQDQA